MNAAQITHIFWKEYRTQRSLWLAMVLLFLVTAVMSVLFLPERNQPDLSSLLFSAMVTVTFYSLASSSILYASEKEQKTDVFLRTLPTNPWLMLGVKISWVLLSSVLAIAIFAGAAYLLAEPSRIVLGDVAFAVGAIAFIICCSLTATLLTRHVFSAIGLSVAFMLGGLVLEIFLEEYDWIRQSGVEQYFTILSLILIAASLELNRRWFRESDWAWGRGIRFGRAMTMSSALSLPVESAGSGRIWRRQVWKEWQSARFWLIGISAFTLLWTLLIHQNRHPSGEDRFVLLAMTLSLVPLLMGVGSCHADQSSHRYLFLGNRGVSAGRLLLTKHAVWLASGAILVSFFSQLAWPDYSQVAPHRHEEFTGSLGLIPIDSGLLSSARMEQLSGSLIPGIQFWGGIALLLYCLGHFFSVSIAQPVMSLLSAIFTGIFVTFLVCYFYALDVPLFVLTVAPAVCLLALSFYRGNDWIEGDRTLSSWKRLACWSILGMWTLVSLMAAWRVSEITWSTVIDTTGLMNLPTYYLSGCSIGFACVLFALLFVDWFRRNFNDSSGRPMFGASRWCTLGGVIGTFLVAHNLLLLLGLVAYDLRTTLLANPMRLAVRNDILEQDENHSDLYQTADEKLTSPFPLPEDLAQLAIQQPNRNDQLKAYSGWNSWADVTEKQQQWLEENQEVLPLFFEADRNGFVESKLARPYGREETGEFMVVPLSLFSQCPDLILLVRLQALKLEHAGQLDEAWKHHLAVVRYGRRFADDNFPVVRIEVLRWLNGVMFNGDLWRWQARKEQTPELLAMAASELHQELTQLSPLADAYQQEGGWSLKFVDIFSTIDLVAQEEPLATLPWERQRLRTLIVQSMTLRANLAAKIDAGTVTTLPPDSMNEAGDRVLYWFASDLNERVTYRQIVLETNPSSGRLPRLLLASKEFGITEDFPTGTRPLLDAAGKAETTPLLMDAHENVSVTGLITQPFADVLEEELQFWTYLDTWIADCFIYSYRAETGQFPSHLGELYQAKRTQELFAPLSQSLSVRQDPLAGTRRGGVNNALSRHRSEFGPESTTYNYTWFHASKWPQPEYNFGETPDRKPAPPLTAPKPEEIQP